MLKIGTSTVNFDIPNKSDIDGAILSLDERLIVLENKPDLDVSPIVDKITSISDELKNKQPTVSIEEFELLQKSHLTLLSKSNILNVCTDTPFGILKNGSDITQALQWALDNIQINKTLIFIPGGEWLISKTIITPFKSGLTVLGAGTGNKIQDDKPGAARFVGLRTLLRWTGESGGTVIELRGGDFVFGNFVIQGDPSLKSKAIVILKPESGIGVGSYLFKPLAIHDVDTAVQCGTSLNMHNCDNLRFEWLMIDRCTRGYRGVNTMGMNIHFDQLNVGAVTSAIEMDGGGKLTVAKSVVVGPCTLLKINGNGGVGKNNGYFRLSNIEIDAQAGNGFTLIDSSEPHPIEFYCDGGIHSQMDVYQGVFARLCGGNHLTLVGWDSSFRNITGSRDITYGRPSVMIRDSRINGKSSNIWRGEIKAKWRDCLSTPWKNDSVWLDGEFVSLPASIDYTFGDQLKSVAEKGYVVYHSQANDYGLKTDILPTIEKTPEKSVLMIDIEDWIAYKDKIPWYGDAPDDKALAYLQGYAKVIRGATAAAKAKQITLGIYEVPTLLWKNYVWVRNDPSDAGYKTWLLNQERILKLAEDSDFLPALRDAGGFVYCVGYLPGEWINNKFTARWMGQLITNMSREFDQRNVPHRWLFRAHGGNEEIYRVMLDKAKGRCDWWEDKTLPSEFGLISKIIQGK